MSIGGPHEVLPSHGSISTEIASTVPVQQQSAPERHSVSQSRGRRATQSELRLVRLLLRTMTDGL